MTVLFLYTELADYFIQCCACLSQSADVHVVRWPVNKEAPFKFDFPANLKIYNKSDYAGNKLNELVHNLHPDMIVCSGWIDKEYLRLVKRYFGKIPTVLIFDTHWRGDVKQHAAVALSRFFLLNKFSHAWVPGSIQAKYAQKLGFRPERISQGFYSCDLLKFNALYEKLWPIKKENFPKRFIYVGRYYEFKGIKDLWQAFVELQAETPNQWELWCLGAGDIEPLIHPAIKHFGFVQPAQLDPIISDCGVFVLPSRFEPWGVVVHEYAAAGFPLLLSKDVGAAGAFLEESANGFLFNAANVSSLKEALKKTMNLSDKELLLMSERSHGLAQKISPKNWAATVFEIYDGFRKN